MTVAALAGCTADGGFPKVVVHLGAGGPTIGANTRTALATSDAAEADRLARRIMAENGTAADAAVAAAFMLAAVLPSRAGLNARGECLVQDDRHPGVEALDFSRVDDTAPTSAFVRAMFTLHARYGSSPWAKLIAPAETAARFGATVSPALAADLREGQSLLSDGDALIAFTSARRQLLTAGESLKQPALADALDRVRQARAFAGGPVVLAPAPQNIADDGQDDAPATSFVATDGSMTVACVLSMGRRFGTGALKDGVLRAAADGQVPRPAIATDARGRLRRAAAPGVSGANGIACHDSDVGVQCDVGAAETSLK